MAKQTTLSAQILAYYNTLDELAKQYATHEGAVSFAFQTLLADTARLHHWTLIPQLTRKDAGRDNRPDGTFKDEMYLVRGYWEAKDTDDDLDAEIEKKTQTRLPADQHHLRGHPPRPSSTRTASGILTVDLTRPRQAGRAARRSSSRYVEPEIEEFEQAVDEFKERVPDLAEGLAEEDRRRPQDQPDVQARPSPTSSSSARRA